MIRERLLLRSMELERVTLGVERDNSQPVGPLGRGRRRLQLDTHLAEDAHSAVAERLEQPAGGRVDVERPGEDPTCAPAGRVLFKPGRDQLSDPPPERVGMDVPFGVPKLAFLAHRPIADDAIAIADDARVLLEVDVQPLILQIGPRERTLAVQRGLERHNDLGHRGRVGGDGWVKPERDHRSCPRESQPGHRGSPPRRPRGNQANHDLHHMHGLDCLAARERSDRPPVRRWVERQQPVADIDGLPDP